MSHGKNGAKQFIPSSPLSPTLPEVYNVYNSKLKPIMSQTETVTIRLPVGVKDKLTSLAISTNRSKSWLAAQAIAAYVEDQSWQIQQIEEAVALADSDQATWIAATEVDEWLTSWSIDHERSSPCG